MTKLVACQLVSGPDTQNNLDQVDAFLSQLDSDEPTLVVLPECFACFGAGDKYLLQIAEPKGHGPIQDRLQRMAKQYNPHIYQQPTRALV